MHDGFPEPLTFSMMVFPVSAFADDIRSELLSRRMADPRAGT
jgi:hypothetical protein